MTREINPKDTEREAAFDLWMKAPNPMVTFFKTLDVTPIVKAGRKKQLKFNMILDYCIGKAAFGIKEFYTLPVGDKLFRYDRIAVNTIVRNRKGGINSCDILFDEDFGVFYKRYMDSTKKVYGSCCDEDLSEGCMVIGTSAIVETELDGAVGMNSGIFNNPFIIWGRYRKNGSDIILQFHFSFTIPRWTEHMQEHFWRIFRKRLKLCHRSVRKQDFSGLCSYLK